MEAEVDRETRHATMRNHTATHLLHAALRERLGTHVRQAGSAVRPDKLRFDFTHGQALSPEEVRDVEDRVNEWVKASKPVRWLNMARAEAERLGAMALFGEKYGEWVRVVEVDEVSRELCGGTHVANTAEVGIFKIASEGSSAANVRRIEAISGPAAIDWFRGREARIARGGRAAGLWPQTRWPAPGERRSGCARRTGGSNRPASSCSPRRPIASPPRRCRPAALSCLALARRLPTKSSCSSSPTGFNRSSVRAPRSSSEEPRERGWASSSCSRRGRLQAGLSAAEIVREAAPIVGGGGGGRDDMAQAGGRDPAKLDEALAAARRAIERVAG